MNDKPREPDVNAGKYVFTEDEMREAVKYAIGEGLNAGAAYIWHQLDSLRGKDDIFGYQDDEKDEKTSEVISELGEFFVGGDA